MTYFSPESLHKFTKYRLYRGKPDQISKIFMVYGVLKPQPQVLNQSMLGLHTWFPNLLGVGWLPVLAKTTLRLPNKQQVNHRNFKFLESPCTHKPGNCIEQRFDLSITKYNFANKARIMQCYRSPTHQRRQMNTRHGVSVLQH